MIAKAVFAIGSLPLLFILSSQRPESLPRVQFNDNHHTSGTMVNDTLVVELEADWAEWNPLDPESPGSRVIAFNEPGRPPVVPAPLIRAEIGSVVRVQVTNRTDSTLIIHGLSRRTSGLMDSLVVPPQSIGPTTFVLDTEGTFYYRGYSHPDRSAEEFEDNAMIGALVADRGTRAANESIMVLGIWNYRRGLDGEPMPGATYLWINGRPWPHTERLRYQVGDSVTFRVINASQRTHPMHLHGFFFRVDGRGDQARDTIYWGDQQRMAVTENMLPGTTMKISFAPDRPGRWLFHCHLSFHVVPNQPMSQGQLPDPDALFEQLIRVDTEHHNPNEHAMTGMGGLMVGIEVNDPNPAPETDRARHMLRLHVTSDSLPGDPLPIFSYVLQEGPYEPARDSVRFPGSPIMTWRGEPTSVMVLNRTDEPTQIHWHGLEIDSYFDGVSGYSGSETTPTPVIMPGDSFEMRITPPRAGSYMYHTHVMDIRQQARGLYGAFIVLDSGQAWDPEHDLIFINGVHLLHEDSPLRTLMNGSTEPAPIEMRVGETYRLRTMNITLASARLRVRLVRNGYPVQWLMVAKDGWEIPEGKRERSLADHELSIGETKDFEFTPSNPGEYSLEVRSARGSLRVSQTINVGEEL